MLLSSHPPFPTQIHICPSSVAPFSSVFLSSFSSQTALAFGTIFIALTTRLNLSFHALDQSSGDGPTVAATLLPLFLISMYFFSFLWQAQRNERESIRQKLALGSFYDDEPVIYTSCSKNGPSSRWVWIECVCTSVLRFDQCILLKAGTNIF